MFIRITAFLLIFGFTAACHNDSGPQPGPTQKGNRRLGFHITETESGNYDENVEIAQQGGMEVLPLTLVWSQVEPQKNIYNLDLLEFINSYYPAKGVSLCLTITPIYAVHPAVPEDLTGVDWNDPVLLERFKNFLSLLRQKLPSVSLAFLSLGNEVDLYLGKAAHWEQYKDFFEASRQHAKSLWGSQLLVGVESTWKGFTSSYLTQIQALTKQSDYIQVSYYPLNDDFTMKSPESYSSDMNHLLVLYPNRQVVIEETGYATSTICQGSPEKQKQFVRNIFKWWDQHAETVPFIGFLWLNDLSEDQARQYTIDYGIPRNKAFQEYLRTTAFRTWPGKGEDKPGFAQLKSEAKSRGW